MRYKTSYIHLYLGSYAKVLFRCFIKSKIIKNNEKPNILPLEIKTLICEPKALACFYKRLGNTP